MTGSAQALAAYGSPCRRCVHEWVERLADPLPGRGLFDEIAAFPNTDPGEEILRNYAAASSVVVQPVEPGKALRLGTRGSALARRQAQHVAGRLRTCGIAVEIVQILTVGDRIRDRAISELPTEAPFTDDIESALLADKIDLAVHSLKDLPTRPREGLRIAAIPPRGDPGESLVSYGDKPLADLPRGAVIGTSSPRRTAQLRVVRPDLQTAAIRGPIDDRIRQIRAQKFDAAILATAGLRRLGLGHEICEELPFRQFLPAPGQGALAIQVRVDDQRANVICALLDDEPTRRATAAELAFLRPFGSLDDLAVAAYAVASERITLRARVLSHDGTTIWDVAEIGNDPRVVAGEALSRLADMHPILVGGNR